MFGWRGRDRTHDRSSNSALLYRLSYTPTYVFCPGGASGIRTHDLLVSDQVLYPAELQLHCFQY